MNTTELWNTYHLDVKRFIQSKVKDTHIAEDLTQANHRHLTQQTTMMAN